jgi:dTMP kinase
MKGYFITLEGGEGAGKSTVTRLLADNLQANKIDFVLTREPGGTEIAEKIRDVLLNHYTEKMHADTELLLYFAGRAQHLNNVIIPALNSGKWVICDRFTDASYAYQGAGRGVAQNKIEILENFVQGELRPDYTLLFDIEVDLGFARIKKNRVLDRLEIEDKMFYERVRNCYLERANKNKERFGIINASKTPLEVETQIKIIIEKIISKNRSI